MRGASVATAQQAPGSVPWTARARVGTLARGLPPRRGVRGSAAPCIKFIVFRPHRPHFRIAIWFWLTAITIAQHSAARRAARGPASVRRPALPAPPPPRPQRRCVRRCGCSSRPCASAAARCHILGPKVFSAQHFLYGVCIQNMARRCAMTRAAAAHSERGGVVRFRGFVGSPPRAGHFRAAAGR